MAASSGAEAQAGTRVRYVRPDEILKVLKQITKPLDSEVVDVREAVWRYSAEDVEAPGDLPPCNISHYDGYAINPHDGDTYTVVDKERSPALSRGEAAYVRTGECLPEGATVVVPAEAVRTLELNVVQVPREAPRIYRDSVVLRGSEARRGQRLVSRGQRLTPLIVRTLIDLGVDSIRVYKRPTVALLPTGTELVKGTVKESRGPIIKCMCEALGARVSCMQPVEDSERALTERLLELMKSFDVVVTTGGVGMGDRDRTFSALSLLQGFRALFRGIAVQPGRMTSMAMIDGKTIVLLPGLMQSTVVGAMVVLQPLLELLQGGPGKTLIPLGFFILAEDYEYSGRFQGFARIRFVELVDREKHLVKVIEGPSYATLPIARAHGVIIIEPSVSRIAAGTYVPLYAVPGLFGAPLVANS